MKSNSYWLLCQLFPPIFLMFLLTAVSYAQVTAEQKEAAQLQVEQLKSLVDSISAKRAARETLRETLRETTKTVSADDVI